jgi:PST family polysaccharide transporter
MILFRILVPEDFGLVSLAMTVIGAIEVLAEFGFDLALIQNQNAKRADYDLAWTLTLIRGIASSTGLLFAAAPAAVLLHDHRLESILTWLALAPLLDGLQNIGVVEFSKELNFSKDFVFKVMQKLTSFVLTIACALWLRDYTALVIGILSGKVAGLGLSYILHPFRPRINLTGWKSIFKFSQWIMVTNFVLYAGNQTDKILINKYADTHSVGIFRVAEEMCSITMEFIWPVERALYPGFVKVSNDIKELQTYLLNSIGYISMLGLPISIGMGLVAEPLVAILLGSNGKEAVPYIQVLSIHGAIRSCQTGMPNAILALGKSYIPARIVFAVVIIRLVALFYGIGMYGTIAAAWSLVVASSSSFVINVFVIAFMLRMRLLRIIGRIWRNVLSVVLMSVAVHFVDEQVHGMPLFDSNLTLLLSRVLVGVLVYPASIVLLWYACGRPKGAETYILTVIGSYINKPAKRVGQT